MIILFGASNDPVLAYLMLRLLDRELPFVLLDPQEHLNGFEVNWGIDNGELRGDLRYGEHVIPLSEVRSVFAQDVYPPPQESLEEEENRRLAEPAWMLHSFIETAPLLVCNRFSACATNFSKSYQQQTIARHGLRPPLTFVTDQPDEAREFYERCGKRAIFKSASARRSIVRRMTDEDLARLESVRHCPTQFQEWVPGVDIRVHVVGRRIFPTEVITDSVDYRYAGRDGLSRTMRAIELPPEIAQRCFDVAESLGLIVAGIDLRRSLDGEYYCFEVNPNPGFTFYEQYTGQRIGDAVVDLLHAGLAA